MQEPTTTLLRIAMKVLNKLGKRINQHAAQSVRQISPSRVAGQLAGQISENSIEQTKRVQEITGLLKTWHGELEQRRRQYVSHHV
jgi:hypothetical protein